MKHILLHIARLKYSKNCHHEYLLTYFFLFHSCKFKKKHLSQSITVKLSLKNCNKLNILETSNFMNSNIASLIFPSIDFKKIKAL